MTLDLAAVTPWLNKGMHGLQVASVKRLVIYIKSSSSQRHRKRIDSPHPPRIGPLTFCFWKVIRWFLSKITSLPWHLAGPFVVHWNIVQLWRRHLLRCWVGWSKAREADWYCQAMDSWRLSGGVSGEKMHATRWSGVGQDGFPPNCSFLIDGKHHFSFHKVRSILIHPMTLIWTFSFQPASCSCQGPTLQSIDQAELAGKLCKNTSFRVISIIGEPNFRFDMPSCPSERTTRRTWTVSRRVQRRSLLRGREGFHNDSYQAFFTLLLSEHHLSNNEGLRFQFFSPQGGCDCGQWPQRVSIDFDQGNGGRWRKCMEV